MASPGAQFGRAFSLQLLSTPISGQQNIVEIGSDLRVRFQITANDIETPNAAVLRVYNLSSEGVKCLIAECGQVIVNAGYGENIGTLFKGTIKQFRRGKERNVDSYLDILAADGDLAYNFGLASVSLPGGSSTNQRFQALTQSLGVPADPSTTSVLAANQPTGGILPRGKVMFGLARYYMGDLAKTANVRWSIQNGQAILVPISGYLPGDIIKINSTSGMISVPEATEQGITVTTLLNPAIKIGYQVQINEADVTETVIKEQFFPEYTHLNLVAIVDPSTEGLYRVIVIEYEGDS